MKSAKRTPKVVSWLLRMAWRDSRAQRKRLFLFTASIGLGIAALVAVDSFGVNLQRAVDEQAKTLLGADLVLSSLQPFSPETEALIDSLGGQQARETRFASMAYFPKTGDTRLVQVRALQGRFPLYGRLGTAPETAAARYLSGPFALVDETLLLQFNAQVGDSLRLGQATFAIAGRLTQLPGEPPMAGAFNPRVFIPAAFLEKTQLLERGSLVTYRVFFRFGDGRDVGRLVQAIKPHLDQHRLRYETVENRKRRLGNTLENLYRFLSLLGFVALILGGIGVASAVHVYARQKLGDVAVLRCLGAGAGQTFSIYLIQIAVMALVGSALGATLGVAIQTALPRAFADFLPVRIEPAVVWRAVGAGVGLGLGLALLFALLPLVSLRRVSPLAALRSSFENGGLQRRDWLRVGLYALLAAAVIAFAVSRTERPAVGLGFALGVGLALGVLALVAKGMVALFKRLSLRAWPYVWRQGLANLYRPNNQTLVLMVAIGLGTFLITTSYLIHTTLLQQVTFVAGDRRPNLVLFDVQPDQRAPLLDLLAARRVPVLQEAPIVTMRLDSLKGEAVQTLLGDRTRRRQRGLLRWEYRTTYRDSLQDSETLVAGKWIRRAETISQVVPVSLEESMARRLGVTLGDTLVWNVQGLPLPSRVTSLRKVDWQRVQANFFVVFPEGVLEAAPQIYVLAARTRDARQSAELQREVVRQFPNVSMIDLALVLRIVDGLLSKVSFAVRFMAGFSILTGLIVLAAAVVTSRFQRLRESVLLRTLGASRSQIRRILLAEYTLLGALAAGTGLALSYLSAWALAVFVFDIPFHPPLWPVMVAPVVVIALTLTIGLFNSRGILTRPPLEVLRVEA